MDPKLAVDCDSEDKTEMNVFRAFGSSICDSGNNRYINNIYVSVPLLWIKMEMEILKKSEVLQEGEGTSSTNTHIHGKFIQHMSECTCKEKYVHIHITYMHNIRGLHYFHFSFLSGLISIHFRMSTAASTVYLDHPRQQSLFRGLVSHPINWNTALEINIFQFTMVPHEASHV